MLRSLVFSILFLSSLMCRLALAECGDAPTYIQNFQDAQAGIVTPQQALEQFAQGAKRITGKYFNQGNQEARYWLRYAVCNPETHVREYRLALQVTHRPQLAVWLYRGGPDEAPTFQSILSADHHQTFPRRPTATRYLASESFSLAPGEQAMVLIDYRVIGASFLAPQFMPEQQWQAQVLRDSIYSALFYGCSILLLLVFALFGVAMSDRNSLMYSGLFALALLWVFVVDGLGFQLLWPTFPAWNHWAPFILLYGFTAASYAAAHVLTHKKWLLVLALFTLVSGFSAVMLPFSLLVNLGGVLLVGSFVAQLYGMLILFLADGRRHPLLLMMLGAVVLLLFILLLLNLMQISMPAFVYQYSPRCIYALCSLVAMWAIVVNVLQLRQQKESALEQALQAAEQEAQLSKSLAQAELNYHRVNQLAQQRQLLLATASHDIRQPLLSLRAVLSATDIPDQAVQHNIRGALDYIESLSNQYLSSSRPSQPAPPKAGTEKPVFEINQVLKSVVKMFHPEAKEKAVELRYVASRACVDASPLELMRVLSNLVSNAILHASGQSSARILVGCRRRQKGIVLQVVDNGPGINEQNLKTLFQAYEKGEQSSGEGLGLAICSALADKNGWTLSVQSKEGSGTCFSLVLPGV